MGLISRVSSRTYRQRDMSNLTLYRNSTIGETLKASLEEMLDQNTITQALADRVLKEFDKQIAHSLQTASSRLTFNADLKTYRNCDNVWTLVLHNCSFKTEIGGSDIPVDKVKIIACESASKQSKKNQQDKNVIEDEEV